MPKAKTKNLPAQRNGNKPVVETAEIQVTSERNSDKPVSADGLGDILVPKFANDTTPNLALERLSGGDKTQIDSIVRMAFPQELHGDIVGIYEDIMACDDGWADDEELLRIQGALSQSLNAWKDYKEISIGQQQNKNPIMGFFPNMANKVGKVFNGNKEAT